MDKEILQKIVTAGQIASQVRREGAKKLAVPGTSFLEVMDYCENKILSLGGQIAWAQMAVNETAAHFCPLEDDSSVSKEGDLIKIDIGVHLDGYLADNAMTVEVGKSEQYKDLIKAAQNALKAAIKIVRPGVQLWELGEAQFSEAEALGFTTIKNLSGHTIGRYKVHGGTSIPAFNNKDKTELKSGWQIAIEPFVTPGQGLIKEKGRSTIFMVEKEKGVRSPYAKKILDLVKSQQGLPFTTRWLTRKLGKGSAALGMRELEQSGIIKDYPPLVEVSGGMVSQFEHSMIVQDKPLVYTRDEKDSW
ncbi:MAG TPA: type II methionyl aminopeptidase [Candidatus Nanoarchaeia archaeon]|nr:type II methionyl aminopeptidase [Candidatus Nanoarchaeia archaeon]